MLVERRRELDLLWDAFADSTGGRGRLVLISGGLASGRTELLHAFSEQVTEHGGLLLTATAGRAEQGLRMGVVSQLCHGPHVPPELLDRVSLLTGGSNTGEPDAAAARQADARSAHALCAMLLELAERRPVVIAVDDVQFADSASLEMLRYLRCRMRSAKLLMVLTEWERPHLTRPPLRAEVTRQPHRRITLGPLSVAGVAELISRRLDTDSGARLARGCYALGGGNPFLTNALIEDQARRPAPPSPGGVDMPTVGAAFREAVLDCLHRWDPEFMRVAGGTAVLGEHATEELVGEL